jgi:hypothetical protein
LLLLRLLLLGLQLLLGRMLLLWWLWFLLPGLLLGPAIESEWPRQAQASVFCNPRFNHSL